MSCSLVINQCFERLEFARMAQPDKIFAKDISTKSGAKQYLTLGCTASTHIDHDRCDPTVAAKFFLTNRHLYEVLQTDCKTRFFMDLDAKPEQLPNATDINIEFIVNTLHDYVRKNKLVTCPFRHVACLKSTGHSDKYSWHLIWPRVIFQNVKCHMKYFVSGFAEFLLAKAEKSNIGGVILVEQTKPGISRRTVVDEGVYTINRCMRIIGQSKKTSPHRILQLNSGKTSPGIALADTILQGDFWLSSQDKNNVLILRESSKIDELSKKVKRALMRKNIEHAKNVFRSRGSISSCCPNGKDIIIRCDQDVLSCMPLGSVIRKSPGASFLDFLGVLSSLLTSSELDESDIRNWTDFTTKRKRCTIVTQAKNKSNDPFTCYRAIQYLKSFYKGTKVVIDNRKNAKLLCDIYLNTNNLKNLVLASPMVSVHLRKCFSREIIGYYGTANERRVCTAIRGDKGSGKTKCMIEYVVDVCVPIKDGHPKLTVLYVTHNDRAGGTAHEYALRRMTENNFINNNSVRINLCLTTDDWQNVQSTTFAGSRLIICSIYAIPADSKLDQYASIIVLDQLMDIALSLFRFIKDTNTLTRLITLSSLLQASKRAYFVEVDGCEYLFQQFARLFEWQRNFKDYLADHRQSPAFNPLPVEDLRDPKRKNLLDWRRWMTAAFRRNAEPISIKCCRVSKDVRAAIHLPLRGVCIELPCSEIKSVSVKKYVGFIELYEQLICGVKKSNQPQLVYVSSSAYEARLNMQCRCEGLILRKLKTNTFAVGTESALGHVTKYYSLNVLIKMCPNDTYLKFIVESLLALFKEYNSIQCISILLRTCNIQKTRDIRRKEEAKVMKKVGNLSPSEINICNYIIDNRVLHDKMCENNKLADMIFEQYLLQAFENKAKLVLT